MRTKLRTARLAIRRHLAPSLSPSCTHVKNHGDLKGAVRRVQTRLAQYPFVARFDVQKYDESMSHDVLFGVLRDHHVPDDLESVVGDYVTLLGRRICGLAFGKS